MDPTDYWSRDSFFSPSPDPYAYLFPSTSPHDDIYDMDTMPPRHASSSLPRSSGRPYPLQVRSAMMTNVHTEL
ncbi:hypothetical protein FSPOR_5586 [Fusarium sporotrichioides]|uniref:Uncharacterized protein n=1 Tax=Fusarium sporotrichioides TaxID=5514 RepID=A0A395S6Q8_FUSSP|nr:hypothetical protein FSPOR_5586 [Fusarium sporotrichioides]